MKLSTAASIITRIVKRDLENFRNGTASEPLVPFLRGKPGVGKTEIVRQVGNELGLEVRVMDLVGRDSTEMAGIPYHRDGGTIRLRPDWIPTEGEGILFFDEMPQAYLATQNVMGQVIQEHRAGEHPIGRGWSIVVAGNNQSDRAGTTPIPGHIKDRLTFLDVEADAKEFVDYANRVSMNPLVPAYIRSRPDWLHRYDPAKDSCESPRSWAKVAAILDLGAPETEESEMIAGQVSQGGAGDFSGYVKLFRQMPAVEDILASPSTARIPADLQVRYAMSAVLSRELTKDNAGAAIEYMDRWGNDEMTAFAVLDAIKRDGMIASNANLQDWVRRTGVELVRA